MNTSNTAEKTKSVHSECHSPANPCRPGCTGFNPCQGHPAGEFDPMGATVYCDGSCIKRDVEPAKAWVVTAPSSYRLGHTCFLGRGATKTEALENAVGPKPWGNAAKRIARNADVYQVTAEEADEMEHRGDA